MAIEKFFSTGARKSSRLNPPPRTPQARRTQTQSSPSTPAATSATTTPAATTPSGTTPSGTTPSGTTPSGTTPAADASDQEDEDQLSDDSIVFPPEKNVIIPDSNVSHDSGLPCKRVKDGHVVVIVQRDIPRSLREEMKSKWIKVCADLRQADGSAPRCTDSSHLAHGNGPSNLGKRAHIGDISMRVSMQRPEFLMLYASGVIMLHYTPTPKKTFQYRE
jgi:hypothetical protein